jgi:hypothetical protein
MIGKGCLHCSSSTWRLGAMSCFSVLIYNVEDKRNAVEWVAEGQSRRCKERCKETDDVVWYGYCK